MLLRHAELKFDVHCYYDGYSPRYRVYIDDDLITERTFIWRTDQYIEENVVVEAPVGTHRFRVENVDPELGTFTVENIKLDGIPPAGNTVFEIV
jgi:hypothetical protein